MPDSKQTLNRDGVAAYVEAYETRHFEPALCLFLDALGIDPGFLKARFNKGLTHLELARKGVDREQNCKLAIESLTSVVESGPNDAEAWSSLATAYGELAAELEDASQAASENAPLAARRAAALKDALEAARRATDLDPDLAEAWNNLAAASNGLAAIADSAQEARELRSQAAAAGLEALKRRPDYVAALYNLGAIYIANGETDEGMARLKEAHDYYQQNPDADPRDRRAAAQACTSLADAHLDLGNYGEKEKWAWRSKKLDDDEPPPPEDKSRVLNRKTGIRHDPSCRHASGLVNCEDCGPDDGTACKVCGG